MENMFQFTFKNAIFSKMGVLFFKIIVILLILIWILRKIGIEKKIINNTSIKILEKVSIGSGESIVIVNLKEIRLVVGVTSKNISLLYTLPPVKNEKY
ncbi:MAG: flagellar biosynthetic protein FliO [Buchnera aphidicola (Nurudea shiraii)]